MNINSPQDLHFAPQSRFRLQRFTDFPSTVGVPSGWLIDVNDLTYHWNGTEWVNLGQVYIHPEYPLASNPFAIEQNAGVMVLSKLAVNASGHVVDLKTRNLTNADIAAILINDALTSGTFVWSSDKVKTFVEATLAQGMSGAWIGQNTPYVPSTVEGSMVAPTPVTSNSIKTGMIWMVTEKGWVGTEPVSPGDTIVAKIDNASNNPNNYMCINKNDIDIVPASEALKGIIQIATSQEALEGLNFDKAMTPGTTKLVMDQKLPHRTYNFGDGSSTVFNFPHNLGTKRIHHQIYRNADDTLVHCGFRTINDNTVRVEVYLPLTPNEYRLELFARLD